MTTAAIGTSALGLGLLVLGGVLRWKKKSLKLVTWVWFFAGVALTGGFIDTIRDVLRQAGDAASPGFAVTTNIVLGIAGITAFVLMCLDAPLKKGRGAAKEYTPFLGLASPILLGAVTSGTLATWYAALTEFVGRAGGPVATFFGA